MSRIKPVGIPDLAERYGESVAESRIREMGWRTATLGGPWVLRVAHMGDETIHTEGERFDIREADGKLYVYDKEDEVKLAYLVQT